MASCSGIGIKEITSTRVLLKGVITGLDSSKRYCLHHFWGGWENVPRTNGQTYTYITGRTSVDLSSYGCYVPKNKTIEGQQFEVRLNEVVNTCESIIREACTKVLWYEVTEQRYAHFYVRDENGNPIDNARIEVSGETKYTGSNGKTYFILDTGMTYYARGYAPSGYTCTDCNESFYHDSDRVVNFYVKKTVIYCDIDFYVCDQELYPVNGATCIAGGKTATTNVNGMCSITLECNNSYTATCNAPSEYTCDCGGCKCSYALVLTGDKFLTFMLDKVSTPIEYCQQDFKVLDQNGKPVAKVILGCEDRTDNTNFEVLGHAGTGTLSDGTVSTLKTIKGRAYNFYVSQFPAGYDVDSDGVSLISDVVACTHDAALFRIKDLSTIPDPCSVNVCVQDQDGNNITGVAIYIKDIGTVYTKDDISMFGCTGKVGITCGSSTTVTATVPSGYEGVKTTETFTASGDKNVILTIMESANGVVCTGKTKAECDAEQNCYWWNSDNACHDTPEPTAYPTLNITSDIDALGGIVAYVDGALQGATPITVSFTEGDIGKTLSVSGVFANVMGTRGEDVVLKAGSNEVALDLLMDNKEILAGGTIAGGLLTYVISR